MGIDVTSLAIRVDTVQVREAANDLNNLNTSARNAERGTQSLENQSRSTGRALLTLGEFAKGVALSFGAFGATQLVKNLIDTSAAVQQVDIRLQGVSKSAKDYADNQAYLSTLSQRLHKDNLTLTDSFAKILVLENAGLTTRAQSKAILEGLAQAAAKTGASNEQLKQSLYGVSQALGQGRLQAQELNQVVEPLPGLLNEIAKTAGVTTGEFRNLVGQGKITSEMFAVILTKSFESYQGSAEKAGKTLTAQYTDISNAWTELARVVESPISNVLTPILSEITRSINEVATAIQGLKDLTSGNFSSFAKAFNADSPDINKKLLRSPSGGASGSFGNFRGTSGSFADETAKEDAETKKLRDSIQKLSGDHEKAKSAGVAHHGAVKAAINPTISQYNTLIASMERQTALYDDQSHLAAVLYDTQNGALKGLNDTLKNNLIEHAKELDLVKEKTEAYKEYDQIIAEGQRLAAEQIRIDQNVAETRKNALRTVESYLNDSNTDELQGLRDQYEQRKKIILEGTEGALTERNRLLDQLNKDYKKKSQSLTLDLVTDGFSLISNNLATTTYALKKLYGEQSTAVKIAFGIQKAAAIASTIVETYKGATAAYSAYQSLGPIYGTALGIAAAAAVVAGGLANVAIISSTNLSAAHGGLDYVPEETTFLLQRGERVVSPAQNRDLVAAINTIQNGGAGGKNVTVNFNVSTPNYDSFRKSQRQIEQDLRTAIA